MTCRHGAKYSNASENELMAWFYDCDDAAFDELWECRLQDLLTKFVASKVENQTDVEDIVNEILVKVIQTKHRPTTHFNPQKGSLRAWVFRIVNNEIANYFRGQNRETFLNELMKEQDEEEVPDVPETFSADDPSEEYKVTIRDAIERLEEPSRTIIRLRFWDKLTQQEISRELGIPLAKLTEG